MKIALVTGSFPPATCGIGDYTCQLAKALTDQEIQIQIICKDDWGIRTIGDLIRCIKSAEPDIVHIQYPTAGYGKKLTPQILSLAVPSVITVHEISKAHILRKLSLYPFFLRSRHVIFTTPFELQFALRRAPWISRRSSVISIGSNITTGKIKQIRDLTEIIYFGLFRPNKGLEEVLALAALVKRLKLPYRIRMIGKPYPVDSVYFKELYRQSEDLPVTWDINLDDETVADQLSRASVAYMPFPDGASGRRGSLLALLANGVVTITTRGSQTPSSLDDVTLFAEKPEQAIALIQQIGANTRLREQLSERGRGYAARFSWDAIARQHIELYSKLLKENF